MTTFFTLNDLGVAGDPNALLQQWLSFMQQTYPGYTPSSGNLEYIQAVIFASWASDVNNQASQGATELFKTFGQTLIGVQPERGSSASTTVTIIANDSAGHTLPVGTQFLLDNAIAFQAAGDLVIAPGNNSGDVTISAITPGSDANGAGTNNVVLNQQIDWVGSASLTTLANGGVDPETDDVYLNRLTTTLQLMAPRPITAGDYGVMALSFQPAAGTDQQEVGRATAIDGYDADPTSPTYNTYNNERMVAVCIADAGGLALNSDTVAAVQAWLETLREANFIVNVVQPNYVPVYVKVSVRRSDTYSAAAVQSSVSTALATLLSPTRWGLPLGSGSGWSNTPTVYESVIESVIQGASGVTSIVNGSLTLGLLPDPSSSSDVILPGPFPLPTTQDGATVPPSAITVVN